MKKKKQKKKEMKKKVIRIAGLVGLFLLVFGLSYALFSITLNGTKKNRIATGNLSLQLLDKNGNPIYEEATEGTIQRGYAIDIDDAVPVPDSEGMRGQSFEFVVKNNGTIPAHYDLKLIDEQISTLSRQYIRYVLYYEDWNPKANGTMYNGGAYSNEYDMINPNNDRAGALLSTLSNNILHQTTIFPGEEIHYNLKIWVDVDATYEQAGEKVYEGSLKLEGVQTKTILEGVAGDDVKTYLYEDGTLLVDGTGPIEGIDETRAETDGFDAVENNMTPLFDVLQRTIQKVDPDANIFKDDQTASAWFRYAGYLTYHDAISSTEKVAIFNMFDECINDGTNCDYQALAPYMAITNNNPTLGKQIAEELLNNTPEINRIIFSEGITALDYTTAAFTINKMITLPSTITNLGLSPFVQSVVYRINIPESVTSVTGSDLSDADVYTLYIPNTVTSADFSLGNTPERELIIDNTESYCKTNWQVDWYHSGVYPTVVFLRD